MSYFDEYRRIKKKEIKKTHTYLSSPYKTKPNRKVNLKLSARIILNGTNRSSKRNSCTNEFNTKQC